MATVFRDANSVTYEPFPWPEFRVADLYLLAAECLNETMESPSSEIYEYVDIVRERAGLEGVVESWAKYSTNPDKPSTKAGMREIIHREREIELAWEGSYFWDIRRWKKGVKEFNRVITGWNVKATEVADYYTVTSLQVQKFTYRDYFAPIPESDIIKNPQLIQNPGW